MYHLNPLRPDVHLSVQNINCCWLGTGPVEYFCCADLLQVVGIEHFYIQMHCGNTSCDHLNCFMAFEVSFLTTVMFFFVLYEYESFHLAFFSVLIFSVMFILAISLATKSFLLFLKKCDYAIEVSAVIQPNSDLKSEIYKSI